MTKLGHNERSFRLDALAKEAREGLRRVAAGEDETLAGWIAYGEALNEGRALFPGDREFGEWVAQSQLGIAADGTPIKMDDRAAAMWAAANEDQFNEAREAGKARTIRGIHAKWKEIEAEREAEAQRQADEAARAQIAAAEPEPDPPATAAEPEPVQEPTEPAAAEPTPADGGRQEVIPPPPADPNAKLRAEFRAMTAEGQADDWIGLRLEVADLRRRVKAQRGEIADLKAEIKLLTEGDDMGRKLGALLRERDTLKGRIAEHLTTIKRLEYRLKKIEGEEISL